MRDRTGCRRTRPGGRPGWGPAHQRGAVRVGAAGQGGDRYRPRRRPVSRRPSGPGGTRPPPGHHRRRLHAGRDHRAARARPQGGTGHPVPAVAPRRGPRRLHPHRTNPPYDRTQRAGRPLHSGATGSGLRSGGHHVWQAGVEAGRPSVEGAGRRRTGPGSWWASHSAGRAVIAGRGIRPHRRRRPGSPRPPPRRPVPVASPPGQHPRCP